MPKIINNKRYDTADNASDDIHRIDAMMSRAAALICDDCQFFRSLKLLFQFFHCIERLFRLCFKSTHAFENFRLEIMFAHVFASFQ